MSPDEGVAVALLKLPKDQLDLLGDVMEAAKNSFEHEIVTAKNEHEEPDPFERNLELAQAILGKVAEAQRRGF